MRARCARRRRRLPRVRRRAARSPRARFRARSGALSIDARALSSQVRHRERLPARQRRARAPALPPVAALRRVPEPAPHGARDGAKAARGQRCAAGGARRARREPPRRGPHAETGTAARDGGPRAALGSKPASLDIGNGAAAGRHRGGSRAAARRVDHRGEHGGGLGAAAAAAGARGAGAQGSPPGARSRPPPRARAPRARARVFEGARAPRRRRARSMTSRARNEYSAGERERAEREQRARARARPGGRARGCARARGGEAEAAGDARAPTSFASTWGRRLASAARRSVRCTVARTSCTSACARGRGGARSGAGDARRGFFSRRSERARRRGAPLFGLASSAPGAARASSQRVVPRHQQQLAASAVRAAPAAGAAAAAGVARASAPSSRVRGGRGASRHAPAGDDRALSFSPTRREREEARAADELQRAARRVPEHHRDWLASGGGRAGGAGARSRSSSTAGRTGGGPGQRRARARRWLARASPAASARERSGGRGTISLTCASPGGVGSTTR